MDTSTGPNLPPIDASGLVPEDQEASTIAYVQNIDLESFESLNGMPADGNGSVASWLQLADDNLRIYELGDIDGVTPVYANDIQSDVIAISDRQCREPVVSSIQPVAVGDKPVVFWIGPPAAAMKLGIDPVFVSGTFYPESGQQMEPPPLPPQLVDMLPPELIQDEKLFVAVNGELIAEFYQSLFDVTWQRSRLDQWFRSNTLQNNIAGWQFALYEFDHATKTAMMTELSVHQVRMDPTVATLEKAAYSGVWLLVDQAWAFRKYPKLKDLIESESRLGNPLPYGSSSNPLAELMSVNFRRKMLVMQVWWFRNQNVKLTQQEAMDGGHVVPTQIPIEQESPDGIPTDQSSGEENGQGQEDAAQEGQGQDQGQVPAPQDIGAGDDAGNVLAAPPPPVPMRTAMIHAQSGAEIDEAHEDWPTRLGLGRMIIINNHVAEWVEEDAWDMQLVHNVCIPVPRKPWGIGEPYRLLNMQRAYNRVWGSMVDHCDWNAHPPAVISESMHRATMGVYPDARVKPGITLIVDDQTLRDSGGKLDIIQPLPQMGAHLPIMEQRMSQKLSEASGNTDVLQGRATDSQARSGKAIELLQTASESTISLKAQNSGDMVYRLDRLILHDISRSFSVEDAMKIVKKYPPQVIRYMLAQGPEIEMEFSVSIAGGGAVSQQRRAKDQQDLSIAAISMETYRDRNNIDHKQEQARINQQVMQQAQQAAMMPQQPAPQSKSGSNGNGHAQPAGGRM